MADHNKLRYIQAGQKNHFLKRKFHVANLVNAVLIAFRNLVWGEQTRMDQQKIVEDAQDKAGDIGRDAFRERVINLQHLPDGTNLLSRDISQPGMPDFTQAERKAMQEIYLRYASSDYSLDEAETLKKIVTHLFAEMEGRPASLQAAFLLGDNAALPDQKVPEWGMFDTLEVQKLFPDAIQVIGEVCDDFIPAVIRRISTAELKTLIDTPELHGILKTVCREYANDLPYTSLDDEHLKALAEVDRRFFCPVLEAREAEKAIQEGCLVMGSQPMQPDRQKSLGEEH